MSIRDTPLGLLAAEDIADIVARRLREDRILDFKEAIGAGRWTAELARDVVAFANAEGGTLVYGIREQAGEATAIVPLRGDIDELAKAIDMVLRENIDERIPNVGHRAIAVDGGHVYVIRVPASPLAPHMVARFRDEGGRFYTRATAGNEPMTARQVKELASRGERAVDRAEALIARRVARRRADTRTAHEGGGYDAPQSLDQVVLHVAPLFPPPVPWNVRDPAVMTALRAVRPFAADEPFAGYRYTQAGIVSELSYHRGVVFLREGAIEWMEGDVLRSMREYGPPTPQRRLIASALEDGIINAFDDAHALAAAGLFPGPYVTALHILDVKDSRLALKGGDGVHMLRGHPVAENDISCGPYLLSSWSGAWDLVRTLADDVWRAYGHAYSANFDDGGRHHYPSHDGPRVYIERPRPFASADESALV